MFVLLACMKIKLLEAVVFCQKKFDKKLCFDWMRSNFPEIVRVLWSRAAKWQT